MDLRGPVHDASASLTHADGLFTKLPMMQRPVVYICPVWVANTLMYLTYNIHLVGGEYSLAGSSIQIKSG